MPACHRRRHSTTCTTPGGGSSVGWTSGIPRLRIAIEYEGDHHRERAHFRQDVARLNDLRAAGWVVLRFTADDVLRHPARVVAQVAQAIRERLQPPGHQRR
ncbi:endonuclease domain-containing protein [Plantactinospora sp. BC1]|uniref:endonuclease domain-containing protein n=1 Tax=Plantactinospora sp. BC1 TaxID=2108470 RepID=UPI001F217222|nr:DUF559 domain-containing protein [Plantactinospora sp. BC1]